MNTEKFSLVVLISGNGSNLQAIIDTLPKDLAEIRAVIANRQDAYGLQRARLAQIPTACVLAKDYANQLAYDDALQQVIDSYHPQLIVLAGFMRVLGKSITEHYSGRMINIHPALLPDYRGLNTHQRVLDDGVKEHGATVHFVSSAVDAGPIIAQAKLQVNPGDTVESLKQRVLALEHQLYPQVIRCFCEGRVKLVNNAVLLDDELVNFVC